MNFKWYLGITTKEMFQRKWN